MISVCCSCWFCLYALLLMLLLCHVSPLLHLVYYTFVDYVVAFPWIIIVAIVTRFVCSICFPFMCFTSWYCGRYYVWFFLILLSFVASLFFSMAIIKCEIDVLVALCLRFTHVLNCFCSCALLGVIVCSWFTHWLCLCIHCHESCFHVDLEFILLCYYASNHCIVCGLFTHCCY